MQNRCRAIVVLLVVAAAATGARGAVEPSEKPLKITAVYLATSDAQPPVDRHLNEYSESAVIERTGVDATWVDPASVFSWSKSPELTLQEWIAAGITPAVVRRYDMFIQQSPLTDAWVEKRLSWMWDAASMRKLLPTYVARLEKYGLTVEGVLRGNTYQDENWHIPTSFSFKQFPKLASLPEARAANQNYYAVGFRDDVLKRIFPEARSEGELQQVFARNGMLTPQDIVGDIPIGDTAGLLQYLRRVKALNLKVGNKPLIPAALSASSTSFGSIDWSLRTIIGYHWSWPLVFVNPPTFAGSFFIRASPDFREYLRWWNTLYTEGLLDPEIFVMKDDQYYTKVVNGEYAVVNFWAPVAQAREAGKGRGYGYRFFPLFYGGIKPVFNNTTGYVTLAAEPVMITRSVSAADLPRVARWVDWYLSEEHDVLSFWGTPEMYTGVGKARRYRPEFRELEDWSVYGAAGGKDGAYFGLQHAYPRPSVDLRMPLGGISFFARDLTYPEAPYFVYPRDPARVAAQTDIWKVASDTIYRTVWDDYTLWTRAEFPSAVMGMQLPTAQAWEQYLNEHSAELSAITVRTVTGPAADFDKNYADYHQFFVDAGTAELEEKGAAWMAEYYRTEILPKQFRP